MKALNRKLLRELGHSRGLLLAIISIIAVGVLSFVYMRSSYYNLLIEKEEYYVEARMADFWIDLKKVPLPELEAIAELPGVVDLRPRIQFYATVDIPRVKKPLNGMVLSLPNEREPIINDIVLRRGSYFTDRRDNEVIVNDAFAREHGLRPGQWIHLLLNNRRQELFIVGTAISPEFVYTISPQAIAPDPEHFGIFYIKERWAEEVFDFDGAANQVVGRLAPNWKDRAGEFLARAEAILEPFGVVDTTPREDQSSNRYLSDEIEGLGVFATFMPVIFLAVAATLLNVLMSRLVDQQQVVVGTLKALGYSDGQVFRHYLKFGLVVGVVGGIVGCVAGYWMAAFVTSIYRKFFEFPRLDNRAYWGVFAAGMVISIICALVGSWHGARGALRLRPAEAMRPKPPKPVDAVVLERLTWLWRELSFGWRMAVRNVIRNRFRTAVGVFAAAMGAALLVAGFMMNEATHFLIDFQFDKIDRSDLSLGFEDERGWDTLLEARRLPGVDYAEPTLAIGCTFVHGPYEYKGAVTGLAEDARLTMPRDLEGRRVPVPPVGLAMTRKLAEILHVEAGDKIVIRPTRGLRRPVEAPVVSITRSYLGLSVYANIDYLSRLVGEEFAVTGAQLEVRPGEEFRDRLYKELKQLPALDAVNERADVIENLEELVLETQSIFIALLVLFAGVIFFGSMLNASLIGLAERQREVATLRVLGYTPWQVGGLFLKESFLVNTLGTVAGLPLGYGLAVGISLAYDTELFRFPVVSSAGVWIWTLLLAVGFGLTAHAFVQRSIFRMDWLEAVKTRE